MLPFLDPGLPPQGVQPNRCGRCGAVAYADFGWHGQIGCIACWAGRWGVDTMRPIGIPAHLRVRYAGGRRPARGQGPTMLGGRALAAPALEGAEEYRIIVPEPPSQVSPLATPGQTPGGARSLAVAAEASGFRVAVTYSQALELATGRLVHAVAVRVAGLGYATWLNGQAKGGWMAGHRVGAQEALALAKGQAWAPAPKAAPNPRGPCPRCGKQVAWRPTGTTFKHTKTTGEECT